MIISILIVVRKHINNMIRSFSGIARRSSARLLIIVLIIRMIHTYHIYIYIHAYTYIYIYIYIYDHIYIYIYIYVCHPLAVSRGARPRGEAASGDPARCPGCVFH